MRPKLEVILDARAKVIADYVISNNATVRSAAKKFKLGKSTIHRDLVKRLPLIDVSRYIKVRKILGINKAESTNRGGSATKIKYCNLRKEKNSGRWIDL